MAEGELLFVGTADGLVIYHSTAKGATLRRSGHALVGHGVTAIVATDAATLHLGLGDGTSLQSVDGGATWHAAATVVEPLGTRVATRQEPSTTAYPRLSGATAYARLAGKPAALLGAGADGAMLFRSTDDGIHWEPAAMPHDAGRIVTLVPSALQRDVAWGGSEAGVLLRTSDRGRSWRAVAQEPAAIWCVATVVAPLHQ